MQASPALEPELGVGDVLLADEIVDVTGGRWLTTWPDRSLAPALRRGRLLTTAELVASPAEKRRLGVLHQAQAVDMEAAHVAARCARHGVPFGCVRAISDHVDMPLSAALVALLAGGRASPQRVVAALLRRPALACELCALARHAQGGPAAGRCAAGIAAADRFGHRRVVIATPSSWGGWRMSRGTGNRRIFISLRLCRN